MTLYSRLQTGVLAKVVHTTCILFYTHSPVSLLVVVPCVIVMNINYKPLQVRRPEQKTALNAKTEQFTTGKISGNALKQWSRTNSTLRHGSSQLQKHQAARMSRRIAVEQRRYAVGMADTQGQG